MNKMAHIIIVDGEFDQVVEDKETADAEKAAFGKKGHKVRVKVCAWEDQDRHIDNI
jgi:hypothetical protein